MSRMPAQSRDLEFRNAAMDVTVAVLHHTEPPRLADAMHKMMGGMPDFFDGDATVLDLGELATIPEHIDWTGILSLFRRFCLRPVAVQNVPPALLEGVRQTNLAILPEGGLRNHPAPAPEPAAAPVQQQLPLTPPPSSGQPATTMIIDRPLRTGQQVYAKYGDIVLLCGSSSGAEIIADGCVHCYGPLRGRVLAGGAGNTNARIFTTNFGPEIVSIGGIYKTFEHGVPDSIAGKPVHVRLVTNESGQKLVIEPLRLN